MKKNVQIHIPTPCLENWDAMLPRNQGRFCGSCAKTVVDFSVMTDNQILTYFQKNTGKTCGHFTADQLERPVIETQLQPKRTWRYWLASIASLLVMMQRSTAQGKRTMQSTKGDTTFVLEKVKPIILGKIAIPVKEKSVSGSVIDENNMPIAGATVMIKNSKKGITTDTNGSFILYKNADKITVIISSVGFEAKEVTLAINNASKPIVLKVSSAMLGEVIVVGYGKIHCRTSDISGSKSLVKRVTPIDTLQTTIAKVFKNRAFTIYPNPVTRSGNINISVKEGGNYEVQVLNNQFKLLYSQQQNTQSTNQAIQFAVPIGAVAGMYYVRLINTVTHKQWVDKLMIQ